MLLCYLYCGYDSFITNEITSMPRERRRYVLYVVYLTHNSEADSISRAQTLRAEYINLHKTAPTSFSSPLLPLEAALPFEKCMRRTLFHLSSSLYFEFMLHF